MKQRLISLCVAISLLLAMLPHISITANAESTGSCGDNLSWVFDYKGDFEGILTITGTGNMDNFQYTGELPTYPGTPWTSNRKLITEIIIESGVASIGSCAFAETNVEKIAIPASVVKIEKNAFDWCYDLEDVYFSGTEDQWRSIDVAQGNECLLDAEIHYAENEGADRGSEETEAGQGYIPAVLDAIEDAQSYSWGDGYGALYDIDGNGIEELIMVYSVNMETDDGHGFPAKACSLYTMSNGNAIQFIDKEILFAEAGGPSGHAAVVEIEGNVYFAITAENGETGGGLIHRGGDWKVYTIDGITIELDTIVEYEYYEDEQIDYDRSFATINGNKCSYREYEEWENGFEEILRVEPYGNESVMTLEELLEYLKKSPVENAPAFSNNTTKRLVQMNSYWDGEMDSTYLYYDDQTGLLERVKFSYDYESPDLVYEYDDEERLIKIEAGDIEEDFYSYFYLELIYDENGRFIKWKEFSPGLGNWEGDCIYDSQGRLVQTAGKWDAGHSEIIDFTYDESGLLLEAIQTQSWEDSEDYKDVTVTKYQYDGQNRVSSKTIIASYGTHVEKFIYSYHPFVIIQEGNDIEAYYDLGYLSNMNVHLAHSFYWAVYGRFSEGCELEKLEADDDGYLKVIEGTLNVGKDAVKSEFVWETVEADTVVSSETAELKVYTTFPYATLGVDQTAKLLITLLVNGEPTPIQEFALGNNNSEVVDLVDTKDADGVRVLTFKTLSPGVANLTFTEGATGATVSIEMAVEEMCSYYRCSNIPIPDASSFPIHVADFQCTENSDGTHNVKFNAYNTSYAYGAAVVYDETGAFWGCVPLNPKYDGTGMEYIVNGFWQSWEQTWYWIDGDKEFYEVAGNAMLTEVEFNSIPQNAKIVITADGRESVYPILYTGIDIFLKVAFYSANIDLKINVYQKSVKEFVVALLKALPDDAAQNTIQTLTTDISMALIDGVNSESVEKIYQAVWNMFENLGLNADEMLKDVLSGLGYSVADTVVIAAVPAYTFVDLVNKIVAVAWLFVDYDSNLDRGKMEIHCVEHASNNQLVNSSVVVIQQNEFSKDTILDAYVVTDAEELGTIPDSVTSNIENYSVYNITLRESGAEVQPGEEIEIRVPIPENVNPDKCVIYRLEDNGTLTLLPSTTENGYIVFTTTHLSYYIVGESTDETTSHAREIPDFLWIVVGSLGAILVVTMTVWHIRKKKVM